MTTKKTVGVAKTKKVITKKEGKKNPNGANQYIFDPRQKLCWDLYIDPTSETFGNATQSAIKAGYVPSTADNITCEKWFKTRLERLQMFEDGEEVLKDMLKMKTSTQVIIGNKFFLKEEPTLVKVKQDTAKFIVERLGKDEGYSSRSEVTGKNGEKFGSTEETRALRGSLLDRILGK